jgi:hypothetical protein
MSDITRITDEVRASMDAEGDAYISARDVKTAIAHAKVMNIYTCLLHKWW